jgi:ribonucleoside-diphosphate reductase alpha chain
MDRSANVENTGSPSKERAQSNPRSAHPERHRLPAERRAITHHFSVGGQEGYLTVGLYEDGVPGELFLKMSKEGSTVSGLMDSFATAVSLSLQYGVPLSVLCRKFSHMRFEPSGWSGNPDIGYAKSISDYIFRWLALRFLQGEQQKLFAMPALATQTEPARPGDAVQALGQVIELGDAPACVHCGSLMVRNGSCYLCATCGSTSGCS